MALDYKCLDVDLTQGARGPLHQRVPLQYIIEGAV